MAVTVVKVLLRSSNLRRSAQKVGFARMIGGNYRNMRKRMDRQ